MGDAGRISPFRLLETNNGTLCRIRRPSVPCIILLLRSTHRGVHVSVRLLQLIARRVDFRHRRTNCATGGFIHGLYGAIDG